MLTVVLGRLSLGSLWGRVEEQSLWSSRHLGEQSPAALLRSLIYLNTKYFGLRTVEQHLRLSFSNVYGPDTLHPVTKETTVCIHVPSISQDHHGEAGKCIMLICFVYIGHRNSHLPVMDDLNFLFVKFTHAH